MKTWYALLLAALILTIGPSVISAQDLANSDKPKGLLTSVLELLIKQPVGEQTDVETVPNGLDTDNKDQNWKEDTSGFTPQPAANTTQPNTNGVHTIDGKPNSTPISESVSNADKGIASTTSVSEKTPTPETAEEIKPQTEGINILPDKDSRETGAVDSSTLNQQTDSQKGSNGNLLDASVNLPVIGNAKLGLLSKSGLLTMDLNGSILGSTHLGVAEITAIEAENYKKTFFGLISADISNPILGDDHIGVLEFQQLETAEGTSISGGLVIVDLNNSPLGDAHIGIGSLERPSSHDPPDIPTEVPTQDNPSSPGKPARPPDPYKPGVNQGKPSATEKGFQSSTSFDENIASVEMSVPFTELSDGLLEAGYKAEQKDSVSLKMANESDSNDSPIQFALSDTTSAANSSSSGGSASFGSGGSGADSFLDSEFHKELDIKNYVQIILQELADEWIKTPPIKPPQATFFLS